MAVKKTFPNVKVENKKVVYKGFGFGKKQEGRILTASSAVCVSTADGKLKEACLWQAFAPHGYTNDLYESAKGILRAFEGSYVENGVKKRRFFYVSGEKRLYSYREKNNGFVSEGRSFSEKPTVLSVYDGEGAENFLFFTSGGVYYYESKTRKSTLVQANASAIACVYHDRAFTAKDGRIYFSAPLAPSDWTQSADGGGYIDLSSDKGEIVGLAVLDEEVCVCFERGISVLSAKGAARDFSVREVPYSGKAILKGSVGVAHDKVVFLTEDGGFGLQKDEVKALLPFAEFGEIDVGQVCDCQSFLGSVYLVYSQKDGSKTLFCYDGKSESGYFMPSFPFESLTVSKDRLFAALSGHIYLLSSGGDLPTGKEASFQVRATNFGVSGEKTLRSIKLTGKGKVRIAVSGERGGHVYTVDFKGEKQAMVCPLLKGRAFDLKLSPIGGEVEALETVLCVYG